jgi:hypothetical protein
VGQDQMEYLKMDRSNPMFKDLGNLGLIKAARDFQTAMKKASRTAHTDKVLIFDGSFGHINLSPTLADELVEKAPVVRKKVEEELLPLWLSQRGLA